MVQSIKSFEVMGSSRRCLVLNINGPVFCSTSNYAYLCMHPETIWDVIERPAHDGYRNNRCGDPTPVYYPETRWVQVYKPTLF